MRIAVSRSVKIARISASLSGLSQTTTRLGVFDEARTRPQAPFSSSTRAPLTVTMSGDRPPAERAARCGALFEASDDAVEHGVFLGVGAIGRHGGRGPGAGQGAAQVRERTPGIVVHQPADLDGDAHAAIVAAADRLGEEVVPHFSKPARAPSSFTLRFMWLWPVFQ